MMTDDQLFGEVDLEKQNKELQELIRQKNIRIYCQDQQIMKLNAFIVEQGLAEDYIKWKGDD